MGDKCSERETTTTKYCAERIFFFSNFSLAFPSNRSLNMGLSGLELLLEYSIINILISSIFHISREISIFANHFNISQHQLQEYFELLTQLYVSFSKNRRKKNHIHWFWPIACLSHWKSIPLWWYHIPINKINHFIWTTKCNLNQNKAIRTTNSMFWKRNFIISNFFFSI